MKCLFIHKELQPNTGGSIITTRNKEFCQKVFGSNNIDLHIIRKKKISHMLINLLSSFIDGLDASEINTIILRIKTGNFTHLFIDTSLLGHAVSKIKAAVPHVHTTVFFHNVETDYFRELIKTSGSYRHYLLINAVQVNERDAVKNADLNIIMSDVDRQRLEYKYGPSSWHIMPTSFEDNFCAEQIKCSADCNVSLLFVGSFFYQNEQAVRWFVKEVVPDLNKNITLYVVGRGFEKLREELQSDKVHIIGGVKNLDDWYYNCDAVVSPIFSGAGMKTKIAEALMYGKTIFGTPAAFVGYNVDYNKVGGLCEDSKDFVEKINNFGWPQRKFNPYSRMMFLRHYETGVLLSDFSRAIINVS